MVLVSPVGIGYRGVMADVGPLILAVDDESDNAEIVRRAFSQRPDLRVLTCTSPTDALAHLQSSNVALLVLDQRMPTMTGLEVLGRAQAMGRRPPCIMITAFGDDAEVAEAQRRGWVRLVLAKPYRAEELLLAVDMMLRRRP